MKRIALTLLLSGCTTIGYWKHNPNAVVFPDEDIHFVRVLSSQYFDHCGSYPQHSTACAVRCEVISKDHRNPSCRTGFAGLPNRWRCVVVSIYTQDQLAGMRDRFGMPVDQHERLHCKGFFHEF